MWSNWSERALGYALSECPAYHPSELDGKTFLVVARHLALNRGDPRNACRTRFGRVYT